MQTLPFLLMFIFCANGTSTCIQISTAGHVLENEHNNRVYILI